MMMKNKIIELIDQFEIEIGINRAHEILENHYKGMLEDINEVIAGKTTLKNLEDKCTKWYKLARQDHKQSQINLLDKKVELLESIISILLERE